MNPERLWFRLFAGIVVAAVAIRVAVDLIRPIAGFLIAAIALVGAVVLARWWRNNRW
jgi:hypothetical protein